MVDQDKNKELEKDVSSVEKNTFEKEHDSRSVWEKEKIPERKEVSRDDKIVSAELLEEITKMEQDENAKKDIEKKKEKIEYLGEKEKIEHLLQIAREKGITFAVQEARKTNDPYLIDMLHDILQNEGMYKKIAQSDDDNDDKKT